VEGFDPAKWPEYTARLDAMGTGLEAIKGRCDAYDALAGRMDAMDEKMGPMLKKWAEQEAAEPEHLADDAPATAGAWRSIFAAADAHKVEILPAATLDEARKAIGASVVGKERADSLSSDALDIAIEMAGKRQDAAPTFDSWGKSFTHVPGVDPAAGSRADADPTPSLRSA
jgi:hypothetical protein